jgi:hypothetical protein
MVNWKLPIALSFFALIPAGNVITQTTTSEQKATVAMKPIFPPPFTGIVPTTPDGLPDGGAPSYLKPETPQQRKERLGTSVDPGINPDPETIFWRFGKPYTIPHYERRWANYDDPPQPGWVRPFGFVAASRELYQQNEKWVWVWQDQSPPSEVEATAQEDQAAVAVESAKRLRIDYLQKIRSEFSPLDVPRSDVTIRFEEASNGLPKQGSYRNSMAVADMNEDGCPDIIVPPQRGIAGPLPEIYLGDCKGNWKLWEGVKWPGYMDYGSVVAADFNKDGHMDLAFGIHLVGVRAMLGDGKGKFVDASAGLPSDYPTRRIIVTDADHDGYPDIVTISEGPAGRGGTHPDFGKLRVYLNREKGKAWHGWNVAPPEYQFGGDWLSAGNFNGDAYPDFIGSSVYFSGPDILWFSKGPKKWKNVGGQGTLLPLFSYYQSNTTGHFTSKKLDDAIVSFARSWPSGAVDSRIVPDPPLKMVVGLDRLTFTGKEPQRVPILRFSETSRGVTGMASGDFDGDGNLDIIYTRADPRSADILLGDGKGNFRHATIEGLNVEPNTNYDIKIADVNGDGRPDVILMYESSGTSAFSVRDGSIHVFLNRGPVPKAQADKKEVGH